MASLYWLILDWKSSVNCSGQEYGCLLLVLGLEFGWSSTRIWLILAWIGLEYACNFLSWTGIGLPGAGPWTGVWLVLNYNIWLIRAGPGLFWFLTDNSPASEYSCVVLVLGLENGWSSNRIWLVRAGPGLVCDCVLQVLRQNIAVWYWSLD